MQSDQLVNFCCQDCVIFLFLNLIFQALKKLRDSSIDVAKTKALFSCMLTMHLICTFVFAYAKIRFYHDTAHMMYADSVILKRFIYL